MAANEVPLVAVIEALLDHQKKLVNRIMAMSRPEATAAVTEHEETMAAQAGDAPPTPARAKPTQPRGGPAVEFDTPGHGAPKR